jgi:hypothetical protein
MVGCGAADFADSAFGEIGLAGSIFTATDVDGSVIVPLVFELVLGVFVLLAIIRNKQFDVPVRSNEASEPAL